MRLPPDADEWWIFDPTMTRDQYVRQTLEGYRTTPTACGRVRHADRDLAVRLYHERVPFTAVEGAFILAAARRTYRNSPHPLSPICSLHYFLPILREILDTPVDPGKVSYLWLKMQGRI
jgi:hypothetical protein